MPAVTALGIDSVPLPEEIARLLEKISAVPVTSRIRNFAVRAPPAVVTPFTRCFSTTRAVVGFTTVGDWLQPGIGPSQKASIQRPSVESPAAENPSEARCEESRANAAGALWSHAEAVRFAIFPSRVSAAVRNAGMN